MIIDQTITIGNIVEAIGFIGSVGVIIIRQSANSGFMRKEIKEMKDELKELANVIIAMAVTTNRLTNVEEDIRDLRRGKGYIQSDVNGEYNQRGKVTT